MGRVTHSPYRHGRQKRAFWLAPAVALCVLVLSACTVKPIGWQPSDGAGGNAGSVFDAKKYVADRWDDPILKTFDTKSVDAATLLAEMASDLPAAEKKYGLQDNNLAPWTFMVKGKGTVLASGAEGLSIDLAPADGKADLTILMGPVVLGTALRDSVGFIKFGDFTNQSDFAAVSTEMKNRVKAAIYATFDAQGSVGKSVDFVGAYAMSDSSLPTTSSAVVVVPVRLAVSSAQ